MVSTLRVSVPPPRRLFLIRSADQWVAFLIVIVFALIVYWLASTDRFWAQYAAPIALSATIGSLPSFLLNYESRFDWLLRKPSSRIEAANLMRDWIVAAGYCVEEPAGTFRFPPVSEKGIRAWLVWSSNIAILKVGQDRISVCAPLGAAYFLRRKARHVRLG